MTTNKRKPTEEAEDLQQLLTPINCERCNLSLFEVIGILYTQEILIRCRSCGSTVKIGG